MSIEDELGGILETVRGVMDGWLILAVVGFWAILVYSLFVGYGDRQELINKYDLDTSTYSYMIRVDGCEYAFADPEKSLDYTVIGKGFDGSLSCNGDVDFERAINKFERKQRTVNSQDYLGNLGYLIMMFAAIAYIVARGSLPPKVKFSNVVFIWMIFSILSFPIFFREYRPLAQVDTDGTHIRVTRVLFVNNQRAYVYWPSTFTGQLSYTGVETY